MKWLKIFKIFSPNYVVKPYILGKDGKEISFDIRKDALEAMRNTPPRKSEIITNRKSILLPEKITRRTGDIELNKVQRLRIFSMFSSLFRL